MFAFCALDCLLHLDPVEAIMAEETAVFHLPNAVEETIWNPVERDPSIMNVAVVPLGDDRLDSTKNHQRSYRGIEKAHIKNFQNGDKREDNEEQGDQTKPRSPFPRFPRHHQELREFRISSGPGVARDMLVKQRSLLESN
jgi:hypothetical protein